MILDTTVDTNHPRRNEGEAAKDGAGLSSGELGVWPQDKGARKRLRRAVAEISNVEKVTDKVCEECGQLYVMRSLVPPYRRPPTIGIPREQKGVMLESMRRGEGGVWAQAEECKWRGNKALLAWPPPISPLPPHWVNSIGEPGVKQQKSREIRSGPPRTRESTSDVLRMKAARTAGHFPEVMTAAPSVESDEENGFGMDRLGFPTERRPTAYRRVMKTELSPDFEVWLKSHSNMIGHQADSPERLQEAKLLLETWRDLFCEHISQMPKTDIIQHRIPTYKNAIPRVAKPSLYTAEELLFQKKMIPELIEAGIIARCESPWSAKTRFPRKSNGKLRMVHAFTGVNDVTVKSNYPMRRIEPILKDMAQPWVKYNFRTDAANGYWAVGVWPAHCYKLAFSSSEGQMCYLRMGQGCTGGPATYSRLKDIVTGPIPEPHPEPSLSQAMKHVCFNHFVDDDCGGAETFSSLVEFLHNHYFPRLAWAKLTLNPAKCEFFIAKVHILGHQRDEKGIRPSEDKLGMFREWPTPKNKEELLKFTYMLPFLRNYIPGRADLTTVLKSAILEEVIKTKVNGKTKTTRIPKGLEWKKNHQEAFDKIKQAVLENACAGGQNHVQYHLCTDASKTGAGGVLFQLPTEPPGTIMTKDLLDKLKIVSFLSFQFTEVQQRYHTTERETLAVIKCLAEVRWLVKGPEYPIMLYTDHQALLKCLKSEDSTGRLARWQLALSEYDLDIFHVPGKDITIADGLSRLEGYPSAPPTPHEVNDTAFMADDNIELTEGGQGTEANEWETRWEEWLDDPWYADIVEAQGLQARAKGVLAEVEETIVKGKAKRFVMIDNHPERNELAYVERSGQWARCLHESEVPQALRLLHNIHGHFSDQITTRRCIGKFFWPSRNKDIKYFCRTCPQCQMLGPLRPSQGLLPIVQLQPWDCFGTDYMGPITPVAESGARFIIIGVDYMSRFLVARAVPEATSANTVSFFHQEVADKFGWPRAVYHDNGSHFKRHFTAKLEQMGVKQMTAPITHPSSVGLAERYVQLLLNCYRAVLQHHPEMIMKWDEYLKGIVNSINTRMIRVYGFSPAQILFGFEPRYVPGADNFEDTIRSKSIERVIREGLEDGMSIEEAAYESRLACIDEWRQDAVDRRFKEASKLAEKTDKGIPPPEKGDLVRLRRLDQDNQKSHKLEPRWEGPYIVDKVSAHGRSLWLKDITSGMIKGRYHVNDTQVYAERKAFEVDDDNWRSISQRNEIVRVKVREWMRKRTAAKKAENHQKGLDSTEEVFNPNNDRSDPQWWEQKYEGLGGYGDESAWNWWRQRGKVIDMHTLT